MEEFEGKNTFNNDRSKKFKKDQDWCCIQQ
jgi:hypothetical protein